MNDDLKTQLTAWALDELPPDERTGLEARLSDLPEAKTYATETREFCSLLAQTLAPAAETTLTADQRAELARQFQTPAAAEKVVRFRPAAFAWIAGLGAIAAGLVLWSGGFLRPPSSRTVAMQSATNAPEAARKPAFPAPNANYGIDVRFGDKSDALSASGPPPALSDEGKALGTQPSVARYDTELFGGVRGDGSANLGLKPEPAGATATAAGGPARGRDLAVDGKIASDKNNSMSLSIQPAGEPSLAQNLADTPAESQSQRRAGGVPAAAAPDVADAKKPTTGPSDPAGLGSVSLRWAVTGVEGHDYTEPEGLVLPAGSTPGEAPAPTAMKSAAARPNLAGLSDLNADAITERGFRTLNKDGELLSESQRQGWEADATTSAGGRGGSPAVATAAGVETKKELAAQMTTTPLQPTTLGRESEQRDNYYFRYTTPIAPESTTESYAAVPENPFKAVATDPLSTFSIDVDTAAYANVRRFLNQGQRPPQPAVRIEEMVNYFRYDYPQPEAGKPFSVTVDLADCPWQPEHRLARVGLKGREVAADKRPQSNLVFLIDVSGSMDEPNKLPLVQQSLHMLSGQLGEKDRVAMVTYAGNSGLALESTSGADRAKIGTAIDRLSAGGSTNGASGIQLAYEVAQQNFVKEGVNRVLLATDGDFNVGVTSQEALQKLITERAKGGVFLSVLGYGMGNLKDSTMEMLADKGNGNYAYIDSLGEARKVLSEEMSGTLVTIAKDVKIQIEFNPAMVRGYRLLGYENRLLAREDFNDDKKDAGEIGAGHTVTALYELVPAAAPPEVPPVDGLKYAPAPVVAAAPTAEFRKALDPAIARETMTVKLRYKAPDGETSQLLEVPVVDKEAKFVEAPADFKFAASVTMFGMLLKDSAHKGTATWDQVRQFALQGKGPDPLGYRGEFIQLVEKARGVAP